jgi:hypothetical protein
MYLQRSIQGPELCLAGVDSIAVDYPVVEAASLRLRARCL